uniref:Protein kinase domain-containing protein n=2 Tax=Chenopodium quinoa TaxID=63459 RepID=A0A803KU37_CHEQI
MSSDEGVVERIKIFTINELEKSTDHFNEDRILGQGGHGTVYKGMLSEGRNVAIKKSNKLEESQREEFINEVVIMSQINHLNILKLLGCCLETDVPLLVYEFIPNGTLYHHIHNPNEEFPITWKMRLHIASDSAGALAYLHSSTSTLIFHRDVKSSNILLYDKYRAKLADFGFSRSVAIDQTRVVTHVMGTPGYLDPEYFQSHQYTEKSDVYSFGVVLVELLIGQKAVRAAFEEDRSLISWFLSHLENSSVLNIIDSQVLLEGSEEEFLAIANLAKQCLILDGKRRPTMKEIWLEINRILSLHVPHINDLNKPKPEQVFVRVSKSANSSTFSLESRVLDSAELSLLFNPR